MTIIATVTTLTHGQSAAETLYISDTLTVPVRSGPSGGHRIVHRGIPSGTRLEVLDRDQGSGFVQVRTQRGTEGWVREQYLVNEPIARDRLAAANARIARLENELGNIKGNASDLRASRDQSESANEQLTKQLQRAQAELAEVKRVSAGALNEHARNEDLLALNARLRSEVDDLVAETQTLGENLQQRWMLIGALLVLAGLVAGFVIKARPRRSGWS
jgi:SH3 domain protein